MRFIKRLKPSVGFDVSPDIPQRALPLAFHLPDFRIAIARCRKPTNRCLYDFKQVNHWVRPGVLEVRASFVGQRVQGAGFACIGTVASKATSIPQSEGKWRISAQSQNASVDNSGYQSGRSVSQSTGDYT